MGVIKRQGIKKSIISYIGTLIGVFSTLFIYPLSLEVYGQLQFLISSAIFLVPFASFGIIYLVTRYFPEFKTSDGQNNGFLGFMLFGSILSFSIFSIALYFFKPTFLAGLSHLNWDVELFDDNVFYTIVLSLLFILSNILTRHALNYKRIVIPAFLNGLLIKIAIPTIILLLISGVVSINHLKPILLLVYFLILVLLGFYVYHLNAFNLFIKTSILNKKLLKEMATYACYGMIGGFGSVLAFRIDTIMVTAIIGELNTGIYSIMVFTAGIITIPFGAISTISSPIIASAWKDNEPSQIKSIYTKSSINLLIIGSFIFLGIWFSIMDILKLTSNYEALVLGKYAVLFLGIGKVIDMTNGTNTQIIEYSKFFRFNLVAILFLGISNVFLNYFLIPIHGITGAAMATAISLTIYNLVKFLFIWYKFDMQPFTWDTLKVLAIGAITWIVSTFIPTTDYILVNIIINSLSVVLLFGVPIYLLKLSPDLNDMINNLYKRIKNRNFKPY